MEGMPMPDKYIKEMFCDRVAASKIYSRDKYTDETAYNYFAMGRDNRSTLIHDETSRKLEFLLVMLKEKGEKLDFEMMANAVDFNKENFSISYKNFKINESLFQKMFGVGM